MFMKVRIKKLHPNAVVPQKAYAGDAGFDLTAVSRHFDEHGAVVYGTGLAFEIPKGHVGLLFPRSSNAKKDLLLSNSIGVLDSGYRGEVTFKFKPSLVVADKVGTGESETDYEGSVTDDWTKEFVTFHGRTENYPDVHQNCGVFQPRMYEIGERIGQLIIIPYPDVDFECVDTLSNSERGTGSYGSSGK